METIMTIVTLLVVLSVASGRLVEIVKGVVPFLSEKNADSKKERRRNAMVQALAVFE